MDALNELKGQIKTLQELATAIEGSTAPRLLWQQVGQVGFAAALTTEKAAATAPRPQLSL